MIQIKLSRERCNLQFAICNLQNEEAVCGRAPSRQFAICNLQFAICNELKAASGFRTTVLLSTLALLFLSWLPLRAEIEEPLMEPPVAGRPLGFTGAIGSFKISARAEPTKVVAEEPLILTVRIAGTGDLKSLKRPDLARMAKFAKNFQVENLSERLLTEEKAVEFDYRIRPRNSGVKQIPAVPFVYYRPGFIPASNGYQTTYSSVIPLAVEARSTVTKEDVKAEQTKEMREPPATLFQVVKGDKVLRRQEGASLPGPAISILAFLLPPALWVGWYVVWLRRLPLAERVARGRRSRAAEMALKHLIVTAKLNGADVGLKVESIVTEFLRGRCDFRSLEPTGQEAAIHLRRLGYSESLTESAGMLFASTSALRFAPGITADSAKLTEAARRFIEDLEAEACTRSA